MSAFFGSSTTQAPPALRRCAARINGMLCGQACESPMSRFCNDHIPGFVDFSYQQNYGRCTHFDRNGRVCQNQITSPNTPFCADHRPPFIMPVQHSMMPTCNYIYDNGYRCNITASVVPNHNRHSVFGVIEPLCEAHALPHLVHYITGALPNQQTSLFSTQQLQNTQAYLQSFLAVPPPQQIQQLPRAELNIESPSNNEHDADAAEKPICSICTDTITVPYSGAVNGSQQCDLHCRHAFHAKCLDQWFCSLRVQERTPTCPNCRAHVNQTDYRKVRQACTLAILIDDFDFQAQPYDDDEERYPEPDPHYFVPRNLADEFDRVAENEDELNASALAQNLFEEVVVRD